VSIAPADCLKEDSDILVAVACLLCTLHIADQCLRAPMAQALFGCSLANLLEELEILIYRSLITGIVPRVDPAVSLTVS
jgi:hypothetical protein